MTFLGTLVIQQKLVNEAFVLNTSLVQNIKSKIYFVSGGFQVTGSWKLIIIIHKPSIHKKNKNPNLDSDLLRKILAKI